MRALKIPPEASDYFRELGRRGGRARAKKLTPKKRRMIARKGGLASRGKPRAGRPKKVLDGKA